MPSVAMLLANGFRPDPRVDREAQALAEHGYRVTVICWDRGAEFPEHETRHGYEIVRVQNVRSRYAAGWRQLFYLPRFWGKAFKELRALRPDFVHCHDLDTTPVGYWYGRSNRSPWIFDAHECYPEQMATQVNRPIYRLLALLERFITPRASAVITVGELLARRFRTLGGKVSVVGNFQPLQPIGSQHRISRADLGLSQDEYVVAYIGGFTLARAILPLIEATEELSEVTLILAGDGPQRASIEAELPTHPQVRYLHWVAQELVPSYTALADVIYYGLQTSDGNSRYSCPNALFNALAAGKPILTTDVGEIADIVQAEQCGLVVRRATPALLVRALEQLRDPAARLSMGRKARLAAETKYNWGVAQTTLLDVYRRLETACYR